MEFKQSAMGELIDSERQMVLTAPATLWRILYQRR
jgi:hypothetical protein